MTDELSSYKVVAEIEELAHERVAHSKKEYVRGEVHTNTVEGFYSVFKRGFKGVYQHCKEKHLHPPLSLRI